MRIYTRKGDDGTTGLLYGGRVRKDDPAPAAYGEVDEAQAVLGLTRAECPRGSELDELLISIERDLWVLMAELATRSPIRRYGGPSGRIDRAFRTMGEQGVGAAIVLDEVRFFQERTRIAALAAQYQIPAMYGNRGSAVGPPTDRSVKMGLL